MGLVDLPGKHGRLGKQEDGQQTCQVNIVDLVDKNMAAVDLPGSHGILGRQGYGWQTCQVNIVYLVDKTMVAKPTR